MRGKEWHMTVDRILISTGPGEVRVAELNDGELIGLTFERLGHESRVGDIFLGRVEAVIHNLQAAFVDIGLARSGFLALPEARPVNGGPDDAIGDYLKEGDAVVVQVTRDPEEEKGAKLTTRPVLTGRDLVFTPKQPGISISRRISDAAERDRLDAVMADQKSGEGGFILRTAAQEAEDEDLKAEAGRLRQRWAEISTLAGTGQAPACLYRELDQARRVLREQSGVDLNAVLVDDADLHKRLIDFTKEEMPDITEMLHLYRGDDTLFESEGVEELIEMALDTTVPLPSGGDLIISETPALTAIDVNTGNASGGNRERLAFDVNSEAAHSIAHQLRLRNLSGLIVIDFVSMRRTDSQENVLSVLRKALADDPNQPFLGGFTRLGLVELTRRRKAPSLSELICDGPARLINSPLTVALGGLRAALREAVATPAAGYRVTCHPAVAEALMGEADAARKQAETELGGALEITGDATLALDTVLIESQGGK